MKRFNVEQSRNGLFVVRDGFRRNLLNEEYERKETAEKVAELFENISMIGKVGTNDFNEN